MPENGTYFPLSLRLWYAGLDVYRCHIVCKEHYLVCVHVFLVFFVQVVCYQARLQQPCNERACAGKRVKYGDRSAR